MFPFVRLLFTALLAAWATAGHAQSSRPGWGAMPYADAAGTGVTFRVWAPNATSVWVPGSFNGWAGSTSPLTQEGTTGYWSADVAIARPGDQYKFLLDGTRWKRDPRGRLVQHTAGNSIVYDPAAFDWTGDTRPLPALSELVIYEMHVGAFYDPTENGLPGTFYDAIDRLDYLADLGINAVELLPVSEFPGDFSWGYNPSEIFAVENAGYGGPDGLKAFVKACHQRGIAVLLDVVHNHYGPGEMDLWEFDGGTNGGIYFYGAAGICCSPWGSRPDYSQEGVRAFIRDNTRMWLEEFHVDGFRWDAPGAMQYYDTGTEYLYIPEAASLLTELNTLVHTEVPGAISIAEDAPGAAGFDGEWWNPFKNDVNGEMNKTSDSSRNIFTLRDAVNSGNFGRVLFTENHDSVGALNAGASRLPTSIQPDDPTGYFARKRSALAATLLMTSPGVPMVFMGQEMLTTDLFSDSAPLDWTRIETYAGVVQLYRDLIRLRRNLDGVSIGLTGPDVTIHHADQTAKLLVYHRWGAAADDQVMVVVNASATPITDYSVNFPVSGTWYVNFNSDAAAYAVDYGDFGSRMVEATPAALVSVAPYSALILSREAHPALDADGDGLPNGWEHDNFGGPTNAIASVDSDGDGANNLEEYLADTAPGMSNSVFRIRSIRRQNDDVVVQWQGGQSARQVVARAPSPDQTWQLVYTNEPPTPVTNELVLPAGGGDVIRVEVLPAP